MWRIGAFLIAGTALVGCAREAAVNVVNAEIGGPGACSAMSNLKPPPIDKEYDAHVEALRAALLGSHCIRRGGNVVLRYIHKTPEIPFVSDTEEFTQLTLEVPALPVPGERIEIPAVKAKVAVSVSGVWHYKGIGWFGDRGEGTVVLTGQSGGAVRVKANITALMTRTDDIFTKTHPIRVDAVFMPMAYESLVSCLGATPLCPNS